MKTIKLLSIGLVTFLLSLNLALANTGPEITLKDIQNAQKQWAEGVVKIGKTFSEHGDYKKVADQLIKKLYAYNYDRNMVLFKPTKASEKQFRQGHESALSYFIGFPRVKNLNYKEDKGFALAPWKKVVFHNDQIYVHNDIAIAMGVYDFTNTKNETIEVEYTFGYIKTTDGDLKIVLHHSSLPFTR